MAIPTRNGNFGFNYCYGKKYTDIFKLIFNDTVPPFGNLFHNLIGQIMCRISSFVASSASTDFRFVLF